MLLNYIVENFFLDLDLNDVFYSAVVGAATVNIADDQKEKANKEKKDNDEKKKKSGNK